MHFNITFASVLMGMPLIAGTSFLVLRRWPIYIFLASIFVINLQWKFIIFLIRTSLTTKADLISYHVYPWIPSLNISAEFGVDMVNLPLLALTSFIFTLILFYRSMHEAKDQYVFIGLLMIALGSLQGLFISLNAITFFIFFEISVIALYLLIIGYGSEMKYEAANKFLTYAFVGSLFLLLGFLYMSHCAFTLQPQADPFSFSTWNTLALTIDQQNIGLGLMMVAVMIKLPMWPLHSWLPLAHVQAPTEGSAILAGVMLKIAAYLCLRIIVPLFPLALTQVAPVGIGMSLIAIVLTGMVAFRQEHLKKAIAYSSIAHMGFLSLGLFCLPYLKGMPVFEMAYKGAYIQMISHGLISVGLFFLAGCLLKRYGSLSYQTLCGLGRSQGELMFFFVFFALANCGLPGTSSFVGELLILLAAYQVHPVIAGVAALNLVIGAGYSLGMVYSIFFGESRLPEAQAIPKLYIYERTILMALATAVLALGLAPDRLIGLLQEHTQITYQSFQPVSH